MNLYKKAAITLCFLASFSGPILAQTVTFHRPFGKEQAKCSQVWQPYWAISDEMTALMKTTAKPSAIKAIAIRRMGKDVSLFQAEQCRLLKDNQPYYDHCPVGDVFMIDEYVKATVGKFGLLSRDAIMAEMEKIAAFNPEFGDLIRETCRQ